MKKVFALLVVLFTLFSASAQALEIHFIDVGQGDSALVLCDEQAMLIDGGDSEDSSLIYSYLKKHGVSHLDYIVATHAHEDHVGGLAGALNYATVDTAYCSVTAFDNEGFAAFEKYLAKQNVSITVPSAGDTFTLGSASVEILAPIKTSTKHNDNSIVLRIVYGDTSFLFTGDAEREEEHSILDANGTIQSTVLKVGHHGSDTSTTSAFLRAVKPAYAVISVGKDNPYGYPSESTLDNLSAAGVKVFRTDIQGTIICTSDGKTVTFVAEKNQDADTAPAKQDTAEGEDYVLNTNTKKFHRPTCKSVKQMKEKNKAEYTGTREELINRGYSPCGNCKP